MKTGFMNKIHWTTESVEKVRAGKRWIRLLAYVSSLCLMLFSVLPCRAEERKTYTYTVSFSAGNQGTLSTEDGVSISVDGGGDYEITLSGDGKTVEITGLTAENSIRFLNSAVSLESESKYYVKGVRMGGRDNSTVDMSYFPVERDQDYVVAYGIKGNLVQYTVNYVDQEGNQLYPPQVYYGNVGDKPVIAYLYVEGYQPQAYNLTGTLQSDASKNIFTFIYRPAVVETPAGPGEGTAPGGENPGGTNPPGGENPGGANPPGGGENPGQAENPADEENPGGNNPVDEENPGGDNPGPEDQTIPDEEVPGGENDEPEQLVDLDDEEVPMGNFKDEGTIAASNREKLKMTWIAAGIGLLAVIILVGAAVYLGRKMKKAESRRDQSGEKK